MSRRRAETIGVLGRQPARRSGTAARPPGGARPSPPAPPRPPEPSASPGRGLGQWLLGAVRDNLGVKALSLLLAVTVFLLVNADRDQEITARIGVTYTLPSDRVLVSARLDDVRITVRGPWRKLRRFDERAIDRLHLDLSDAQDGEVALRPSMVNLPAGLTVTSISPQAVRVAFEQRRERELPVSPTVTGRPMHGYHVVRAQAEPTGVVVRGAAGPMATATHVRTEEIRVDGRDQGFTVEVGAIAGDELELVAPRPIQVRIDIAEQLTTELVTNVAVVALGPLGPDGQGGAPLDRVELGVSVVDVVLTGTVRAVERQRAKGLRVIARLGGTPGPAARGQVPLVLEGIEPGVGAEVRPALTSFRGKK